MFRRRRALMWKVLGLAIVAGFVGCGQSGPPLGSVSGVVRVNGKPVPDVMVEFQPERNGSTSVGYTDEDGEYTLQFTENRWGAMVGRHIVRLDFDYTPWGDDPIPPFQIPARYNSNTELKVEVTRGSNSHDFEIHLDPTNADTAVNWR